LLPACAGDTFRAIRDDAFVNRCQRRYAFPMSRQSTLNVSLTAELQKYVKYKLDSGGYESASEVIRDGQVRCNTA
jgi:hypothetical protein